MGLYKTPLLTYQDIISSAVAIQLYLKTTCVQRPHFLGPPGWSNRQVLLFEHIHACRVGYSTGYWSLEVVSWRVSIQLCLQVYSTGCFCMHKMAILLLKLCGDECVYPGSHYAASELGLEIILALCCCCEDY